MIYVKRCFFFYGENVVSSFLLSKTANKIPTCLPIVFSDPSPLNERSLKTAKRIDSITEGELPTSFRTSLELIGTLCMALGNILASVVSEKPELPRTQSLYFRCVFRMSFSRFSDC